ncbi:MAG TPA: trypsin-like peptidase domain-containing protein [Beijerinckiaceae bacterium]|nr:trypsin-like peptidase domain-containing protein [Beijerinckiaceae bacterium]
MKRVRWMGAALAGGLALLLTDGTAAQPAPPGPTAPTPSDPAYGTAKAAFEALSEDERKAIQDALVWTGDYNSVVTGIFSKRTYDALVAYQRRAKRNTGGILDPKARADLQAAAQRAREAVKFATVADPKTGVRIGIPERLLSKRDVNPNGGTRWQSADEKITLDTRAIPAGETDLQTLYERDLAIQTPGRQVTYKVLRPDFFVITGETPTGKFYIRQDSGRAGIRGFSLGYDKAIKDFDRVVIAIANSFTPFPKTAPAVAAVPTTPPRRPAAVEPPRPATLIASGLIVAQHRVLTIAGVETCPDLRGAQAKARVVKTDKTKTLALLEWEGTGMPGPLALQAEAPTAGEELVVMSFTGSELNLVATPAAAVSGRLVAPLQPGASGGAAFSRGGALVGLVGPLPAAPRMVAGVAPPMTHPMTTAEAVSSFLTENGVTLPAAAATDAPRSAGEIVSATGTAVVPIACVR